MMMMIPGTAKYQSIQKYQYNTEPINLYPFMMADVSNIYAHQ